MSKINNQNCECPISLPKMTKQLKPKFTQNICKKNVPLLLCNYKKQNQLNKSIFERNFSDNLSQPIIPIRPNFDICNNQKDLNKGNNVYNINNNLKNKIEFFKNIKTQFIPGKGQGIDFLKNIDVDSELKSLNFRNTLCDEYKHNPLFSNNDFFSNTYIDNKFLNKNINYIDDSKSIVGINYIRNNMNDNNYCSTHNNCTNMSEFRRCNKKDNRAILLKTNVENCPKMQVGPERKNHTCENLWSNVTRRKHLIP